MRAKGGIALVGALLATAAAAIPGYAAPTRATPWLIGAAKVDTTPPAFDAHQDLQDFPDSACPRALYDAPRLWRFEEPYRDSDGNGQFDYPDPNHPGSGDQY